jgi:Zn-dependent membrane protease YugP
MWDWILLLVVLTLQYGPAWFFEQVVARYDRPRADLPLSGKELARQLLDHAGLKDVTVERLPDEGNTYSDNYNTKARVLHLSPTIFDGHSLAAYAVAAHESGHALQFAEGRSWLIWDERIGHWFGYLQYGLLAVISPFIAAALIHDLSDEAQKYLGLTLYGVLGCSLILRFVTLPTELDASFGKALPLLRRGQYLGGRDLKAAAVLLSAAALTYAAFAALGLLVLISFNATFLDRMR